MALRDVTPSLLRPDRSFNGLEGCRCRRATVISGSVPRLTTGKALSGQCRKTPQNKYFVALTVQCTPCISLSHTGGPPIAFRRARSSLSASNGTKSPLSRTGTNHQLGWEQFRSGLHVRAQAQVGRADGQAEFETGLGMDENGRKRWSSDQDRKKATALEDSTIYPIMRVYRDDLCTLEITGDAQAWQAIEAMAADGGRTAAEEFSKGRPLMTIETIIPGRSEDHSTVSTKLLAPTHLVNRAAKTIWIHKKISMSSGTALARAFQRVVMQHVLTFDIHIRSPGTARDMANLANETEDGVVATLESRDAKVLEGLAQVLSTYSMSNIKDNFHHRFSGQSRRDKIFTFWRGPEWIWALNKAIGVRSLSQNEIREQAKRLFDRKNASGEINRTHQAWWPTPPVSLPSIFLPEQGADHWSTEFVPMHKIQIDSSKVKVFAKGWQRTKTEQVLELDLTHAQLVDLADMLDLYYEDKHSTPAKTLRSGVELKVSHLSQSKVAKTVWTLVLSCIAGGVLLVSLLLVPKLKTSSSDLLSSSRSSMSSSSSSSKSASSFTYKWCRVQTDRQPLLPKNEDIPAEEMESLCLQVVSRLKDEFNLTGQVESSPERGAWIGSDLSQWGRRQKSGEARADHSERSDPPEVAEDFEDQSFIAEDSTSTNSSSETLEDSKSVLLYQVVLTRNGKLVGFQPGNKAAIGLWADFPFARELHKGRRLGAGLWERGLKFSALSEEVVAIELLCDQSSSPAFTARPLLL